jgi:hypothetical protein
MKIKKQYYTSNLNEEDKIILDKLAHYIIYEDAISITKLKQEAFLTEDEYKRLCLIYFKVHNHED